jgi:hypothetical protein
LGLKTLICTKFRKRSTPFAKIAGVVDRKLGRPPKVPFFVEFCAANKSLTGFSAQQRPRALQGGLDPSKNNFDEIERCLI